MTRVYRYEAKLIKDRVLRLVSDTFSKGYAVTVDSVFNGNSIDSGARTAMQRVEVQP